MWIRSQDGRRLVQVSYLYLVSVLNSSDEECIETRIQGGATDEADFELGTYETEERALEVLDEIQNQILNNEKDRLNAMYYSGEHHKCYPTYSICQMPKE